MINSYISQQIERNFPYKPTDDQFLALHTLTEFLLSEEPDSLLLMKGYAGTGKTADRGRPRRGSGAGRTPRPAAPF